MKTVIVCENLRAFTTQPSCARRGSKELAVWFEAEVARRGLDVTLERVVCLGHCQMGPNFRVIGGDFVHEATREKLAALLDALAEQPAD